MAKEEAAVQALGLKYFHLPVDSSRLTPKLGEEFLRIVSDESNRPLFIHCASANRVGAFWILHRVVNHGWSLPKAEEEARKIGLRSPKLLEFARNYLEAGWPLNSWRSDMRWNLAARGKSRHGIRPGLHPG